MTSNSNSYPVLRKVVQVLYFTHLALALSAAIYILCKHPQVVSPTISFAMLILYGFMLVWALFFGFILILCKQQQKAVCMTRILVKLIILAFPAFGLLSIHRDHHLNLWEIKAFILYMTVVAALLLVYEVASCLCCGQKYPDFLFEQNDLQEANTEIFSKRKEYDDSVGRS